MHTSYWEKMIGRHQLLLKPLHVRQQRLSTKTHTNKYCYIYSLMCKTTKVPRSTKLLLELQMSKHVFNVF